MQFGKCRLTEINISTKRETECRFSSVNLLPVVYTYSVQWAVAGKVYYKSMFSEEAFQNCAT